jgi:hypothetical protein
MIKRSTVVIITLSILLSSITITQAKENNIAEEKIDFSNESYESRELLIKFKENVNLDTKISNNKIINTGIKSIDSLNDVYRVESLDKVIDKSRSSFNSDIYKMKIPKDIDIEEILADFADDPNVECVEPNYKFQYFGGPNDPDFDLQWYLESSNDCDIDYTKEWSPSFGGGSGQIIAVVDSGVNFLHPDLNDNIWTNNDEIPNNGLDDDNNGYIDDYWGYHYLGQPQGILPHWPMDTAGHGTLIAGVAAAETNNRIGIAGVADNCQIMCVKVGGVLGLNYSDAINGINYAANNGADVIIMCWGGASDVNDWPPDNNLFLLGDAINNAKSAGAVLVAAAGNSGSGEYVYPAAYDNVIAVGGTNKNDGRWSSSNHGNWVDVAAPAENIHTTGIIGYTSQSGTSFAAPQVAGIAALTSRDEDYLKYSVDMIETDKPIGTGRINANVAITGCPGRPYKPDGPQLGVVGENYTFKTSTLDPNDNELYYQFDWGDGNKSSWIGPFSRSIDKNAEATYSWETPGEYFLKVIANDSSNQMSEWSFYSTIYINSDGEDDNDTENKTYYDPVVVINGPTTGGLNELLTFDASASFDPDGGNITRFDWHYPGSNGWNNDSGASIKTKFSRPAVKTIKVRVHDEENNISIGSIECEIANRLYIQSANNIKKGDSFYVTTRFNHKQGLFCPAFVYFNGTNKTKKTNILNLYTVKFSTKDLAIGEYSLEAYAAFPFNLIVKPDQKIIKITETGGNNSVDYPLNPNVYPDAGMSLNIDLIDLTTPTTIFKTIPNSLGDQGYTLTVDSNGIYNILLDGEPIKTGLESIDAVTDWLINGDQTNTDNQGKQGQTQPTDEPEPDDEDIPLPLYSYQNPDIDQNEETIPKVDEDTIDITIQFDGSGTKIKNDATITSTNNKGNDEPSTTTNNIPDQTPADIVTDPEENHIQGTAKIEYSIIPKSDEEIKDGSNQENNIKTDSTDQLGQNNDLTSRHKLIQKIIENLRRKGNNILDTQSTEQNTKTNTPKENNNAITLDDITYKWDFGDGSIGYGIKPEHTYKLNINDEKTEEPVKEKPQVQPVVIPVKIDMEGITNTPKDINNVIPITNDKSEINKETIVKDAVNNENNNVEIREDKQNIITEKQNIDTNEELESEEKENKDAVNNDEEKKQTEDTIITEEKEEIKTDETKEIIKPEEILPMDEITEPETIIIDQDKITYTVTLYILDKDDNVIGINNTTITINLPEAKTPTTTNPQTITKNNNIKYKKIEEIKTGDIVQSIDANNKERVSARVSKITKQENIDSYIIINFDKQTTTNKELTDQNQDDDIKRPDLTEKPGTSKKTDTKIKYHVMFSDGKKSTDQESAKQELKMACDQKIITNNQQIITAEKIKTGDQLYTINGEILTVKSVTIIKETVTTYNIELENHNIYFANDIAISSENINSENIGFLGGTLISMGTQNSIINNQESNEDKSDSINDPKAPLKDNISPLKENIIQCSF